MAEIATSKRVQTRQQVDLSRFIMQDKENLCIYMDNIEEPAQRSPLPVGYPRLPLQDITDVLSPLNRMIDFKDKEGGKNKPKPKARKKAAPHPCPILDGLSTSSQDPASRPGPETRTTKGILTSLTNSKENVEIRTKKTVRFASTETNGKVDLCAEETYEVKTVVQRSAAEVAVNPPSPNSQGVKRRKPPAKSAAGRNVARFR